MGYVSLKRVGESTEDTTTLHQFKLSLAEQKILRVHQRAHLSHLSRCCVPSSCRCDANDRKGLPEGTPPFLAAYLLWALAAIANMRLFAGYTRVWVNLHDARMVVARGQGEGGRGYPPQARYMHQIIISGSHETIVLPVELLAGTPSCNPLTNEPNNLTARGG